MKTYYFIYSRETLHGTYLLSKMVLLNRPPKKRPFSDKTRFNPTLSNSKRALKALQSQHQAKRGAEQL